jgi:PLD-like domain
MTEALSRVETVIRQHLGDFQRPGVLSVRPGYKFRNGWPVDHTPAIVVTVAEKTAAPPDGRRLPVEVDGVPVDVRQASARKRRALDPHDAWPLAEAAPDSGTPPQLPGEVRPDGTPVAPAALTVQLAAAKPQLTYRGPDGVALAPVSGPVTVEACASPDAGWPVLKSFLATVDQTLTIGLYDWTSRHVLDWFSQQLPGKTVRLVLDHPAKNPTADQTDEDTVGALRQALGTELTQSWALERADPLAAAWIYPSAYHIKVAVADSRRVWLSSGNWNNSNQPDIDPVTHPADADAARDRDRDWHVVIDSPELARVFEAYLLNDLTVAEAHQQPPAEGFAEAAPAPVLPTATAPVFHQFFGPVRVTGRATLTPLLTPDPGSYADHVSALIASATSRLYMQFQYIELPKAGTAPSPAFANLVATVVARQQAGVDVRIVMSEFETQGYLEQLMTAGLDVARVVRIQNNVHNKGIVVDGRTVLVSSQNWSNAGTTQNRDAGVISEQADLAGYFERIFLHDWEHLARAGAAED